MSRNGTRVLIAMGILIVLLLVVWRINHAYEQYRAKELQRMQEMWERMDRRAEEGKQMRRKEWLDAYHRRLGPLDTRNQAAMSRLREQLTAMSAAYVEAKQAPAKRCPAKLEGQAALAWEYELDFFASGSTTKDISYGDSGYSNLYERYLHTEPEQKPLDAEEPNSFRNSFNVDAETLLQLPYMLVASIDKEQPAKLKGDGYEGGRVVGAVHLFDLANRRYLCRTPFIATNSEQVSFSYTKTRTRKVVDLDNDVANAKKYDSGMASALRRDLGVQTQRAIKEALHSLAPQLTIYVPIPADPP